MNTHAQAEATQASTAPKKSALTFKRFKPLLPNKFIVSGSLLLAIVETVSSLMIPLVTMRLIDQIAAGDLKMATIILLAVLFLAQTVLSAFSAYSMSYVGQYMIRALRDKLWKHLIKLPVPFFDRNQSGELMSRIANDSNVIKDFLISQIMVFISGMVSIIGGLVLLFVLDWKITVLIIVAVPLSVLLIAPLASKMYGISRNLQTETANLQGDFGRVLADIRFVKYSVAEQHETDNTSKRISKLFKLGMKESFVMSIVSPVMLSIILLVVVLIIGYGGIRVAQGLLSTGALIAIILYLFQIVVPFTQLATFFTQFQKANGASERIFEILEEEEEVATIDHPKPVVEGQPLIFEQVDFSYNEDRSILDHVTCVFPPRSLTAIVGPSGSGKTTIFSLIEQFYTPTSGTISYGSAGLQQYSLSEWRNKIAYVSQESPVMAGTIADQLKYGLDNVTEEQLWEALRGANLESFVRKLPQGLLTEVGERGLLLSGGQRQRLNIARVFLKNPQILLLDEATAHLDSQSEHEVREALQEVIRNRTTIMIAHRMATIKDADQIIVLEHGKITGIGKHEELIESNDCYRTMIEQQQLMS